jgi:outer membrane protein assembly factor BamB
MSIPHAFEPAGRTPLRLWPGVVAVLTQWFFWLILPVLLPEGGLYGVFGAVGCSLAVFLWWMFFSRAPWSERIGAIILMIAGVWVASRFVHESIAGGMQGMMLYVYSIPVLCLALVTWAGASRGFSDPLRRATLAAAIFLACGSFTLVRTAGIVGSGGSDLSWRWTPSPEEILLARASDDPIAPVQSVPAASNPAPPPPAAPEKEVVEPPPVRAGRKPATDAVGEGEGAPPVPVLAKKRAEWPGFRGPNRDAIVRGLRIETDWSRTPPVALWRRPIGPGWSSFAVRGDLIYTQEQRGDDEIVSAYQLTTGEPVWRHRDAVRFWESNGGAGPRATPTVNDDRVYAFGATGILNALDATTGAVVWTRNVASDTGRRVPDWGFASSPLVVDEVVIVAAAGTLAGYDTATGKQRWQGPSYGGSYSSPHRVTVDGVLQVVLLGGPGAISVAPADGTVLWEHKWSPGAMVQPAVISDDSVLVNAITATGGIGTRRLAVAHQPGGWNVEQRWTSNGLKPYFNDLVVHKGHAFGFDGTILSAINLEDGVRRWKGGRYGSGQLVLFADQDVLLVVSEEGELVLVSATPDQFTEIARVPGIDGKTWNHPAVVGDVLLVRNGEEMAAFRLPRVNR